MSRDADYIQLITSTAWRALRRRKLNAQPLCERCKSNGYIRSAQEVHHRRPVETAKDFASKTKLMFDYSNLMSVCHECHVAIHKYMRYQKPDVRKEAQAKRTQELINKMFGECNPGDN